MKESILSQTFIRFPFEFLFRKTPKTLESPISCAFPKPRKHALRDEYSVGSFRPDDSYMLSDLRMYRGSYFRIRNIYIPAFPIDCPYGHHPFLDGNNHSRHPPSVWIVPAGCLIHEIGDGRKSVNELRVEERPNPAYSEYGYEQNRYNHPCEEIASGRIPISGRGATKSPNAEICHNENEDRPNEPRKEYGTTRIASEMKNIERIPDEKRSKHRGCYDEYCNKAPKDDADIFVLPRWFRNDAFVVDTFQYSGLE